MSPVALIDNVSLFVTKLLKITPTPPPGGVYPGDATVVSSAPPFASRIGPSVGSFAPHMPSLLRSTHERAGVVAACAGRVGARTATTTPRSRKTRYRTMRKRYGSAS